MPTIEQNLAQWASNYDWDSCGDEWSTAWGGTPYLWYGVIYPRILALTPVQTLLEIAPGYGRCTQYLQFLCHNLSIVDLSDRCIDSCKQRFSSNANITYHVNDGKSLDMIENESIDFVFSWDSLVHVENDVMGAYIEQLSNKLSTNGFGFIHHSNIGVYKTDNGQLSIENKHWRGSSMTAELFREYCKDIGLHCLSQEIIKWGGDEFNDCFSLFTKDKSYFAKETSVYYNSDFMIDACMLKKCSELYNPKHLSTLA